MSSPGADLGRETGGCSHADQRQTGREESPYCPSIHLSVHAAHPGCTYHIPEERIEDNGKDGSHKMGFREVHVAEQPGHNAEVCLKGQSGVSGRRACPTRPHPAPPGQHQREDKPRAQKQSYPPGTGRQARVRPSPAKVTTVQSHKSEDKKQNPASRVVPVGERSGHSRSQGGNQ